MKKCLIKFVDFREKELRKKLCDELFFPRVFDNIKQN